MKKIFTLFFALFMMVFCAKAQYLLQEGFEGSTLPTGWTIIDNDNDGSNWELTGTAEQFSTHTGNGVIVSASYDNDASTALTPDNWLITPAINITSNADLTFWVKGQDPSYASEYYSVYVATANTIAAFTATTPVTSGITTGDWAQQTVNLNSYVGQNIYIAFRHHYCTDMFFLNLDDVEIFAQPTSPTLTVEPTTIDFGTIILSDFESATATVTAYSLTTGITATTMAPFSVSADDITYGTTATIDQNGGTLYVKYTPTAAGNHNGMVTLSSTGATDATITLTGNCVDCAANNITTFPYVYTFNDGIVPPLCWGYDDAAHFGVLTVDEDAGDYAALIGVVDYLITPEIISTSPLNMSIDYLTYAGMNQLNSSSTFRIGYSTTNNNYSSFTWLTPVDAVEATGLFSTYSSIIPAGTKYIAIDVTLIGTFTYGYNSYYNYLFFDNLTLSEINNAEIFASTDDINFGTVQLNNEAIESVSVVGALLTSDITATTVAPFAVSSDGTTYGTTATIAQAGGTLYVKYAPTTVGTDNGTITLSSTGATNVTITLDGNAVDCGNFTLPFSESFEDAECPASCWTIVYGDGDPSINTMIHTADQAAVGSQSFRFSSYSSSSDYTQYLITPALPTGDKSVSFDYKASNSYGETFAVGYSTSSNPTSFTWGDNITATNTDWLTYTSVIPATATYIAIKYASNYQYYLYIDNFQVIEMTSPSLSVSPDALGFTYILGATPEIQTANVIGSVLSGDINIGVTGPFEVSTDGTTFGTTATIAQTVGSGTLYVKYVPTAAGTHTGTVTISTTGATDVTIALDGVAISCDLITTFPYAEDFENTAALECWTIVDANNDSYTFSYYNGQARYRYSSDNPADDWLISPEFTFTGTQIATIDYRSGSSYYSEKFVVAAITGTSTTGAIMLTDTIDVTNSTDETLNINLSSLNGNYRIGIHCVSDADQLYLYVDNFNIIDISTESISVDPTTLTFSSIANVPSNAQTVTVNGFGLTNNIAVSTTAPFEVSADNTTFGTTATLTPTGAVTNGTFYVRYNPTAAGTDNGMVTVTSGAASATVTLTGTAIDCSSASTLPFTEDFEGELSECWLNIDADGDGFSWYSTMGTTVTTHSGDAAYASASYDNPSYTALTPNNWLITPAISIPATGAMLTWWVAAQDANYAAEHYQVMVSTTGTAATDFTSVFEETLSSNEWAQKSVALTSYTNQTIHIAFVHNNCTDMFVMKIDDISVTELSADPTIEVNPTAVAFGNLVTPNTDVATVNVTAYNLTADIAISTAAPYTVSTDGINYNTTATMTQPGGVLYIQYAPIAAGSYNGMVNLTSGTANATITLTGTATEPADCNTPASLPFIEGFEGEDVPDCWTTIDADGDGHDWYVLNNSQSSQGGFVVHSGEGHITSASYASVALTPDNWLITPQIAMGTNGHLSFWAAGQDPSYAAEVFSVYLSTTGPATSDFTVTLLDHQTTTGTMTEYTADLSAYAGQNIYIAFRHHDVTDMFRLNLDDVSITGETSIADVESNNVSVYPNPANNVINVNANSNISNVEVFTIAGQKVGDFTANSTNTAISTANLTNGLYMMKIHTENGVINKKFSVVR